jgi:hypothetical protein
MKKERIEDLGAIRVLLIDILDYTDVFELANSKHSIDSFVEHYKDEDRLCDLHGEIRFLKDKLWHIYSIAKGDNYDDED